MQQLARHESERRRADRLISHAFNTLSSDVRQTLEPNLKLAAMAEMRHTE